MEKNYLKKLGFLLLFVFVSIVTYAQTGSISGKVVDEANQPLPGAAVFINGTQKSTQTDLNGNYQLNGITYANVSVTVRFIGYDNLTKSINLNSSTAILNFNLKSSAESLNEVVVVGYGTVKKNDVTGSITTVSAKDFTRGQITSPEQLIAGKVAGVQITQGNGAPGSGSNILIRGGASFGNNYPLIVVDGVPLDQGGIAGSPNSLNLINPNDIETFTVLKDASATAIYGNRGSNGVIIITTKKGETGKPKFSFITNYAYQTVSKKADILSPIEFRDLVFNAPTGSTVTPQLKAQLIGTMGKANTDWQNEIYANTGTSDNNFSVSGSTKNMPYRFSLGYLDQNGTLRTGNLKRTTLGINLNPSLFKNTLKVNLSLKGSLNNNRFADEGAIGTASRFDPTQPVLSGNGNFGGYFELINPGAAPGSNPLIGLGPRNPVSLLDLRNSSSEVYRTISSIQLDYAIPFVKGLRANVNVGYDMARGKGTVVVPEAAAFAFARFATPNGTVKSGVNNQYRQERSNLVTDFYFNYLKELKSINSRIDITAGSAYQEFESKNYSFADFSKDGTKRPNSDPNFLIDIPQNRLFSLYSRLVYTYNNKYTFTGTVRSDASSRLNPEDRVGVFPSGALAWRVSEENFLKSSNVVSDLKLRVGYGITGQQEGIDNYSYLGNYGLSTPTAQYQLGTDFFNLYRPVGYNPNLKWESTATSNIGLDFGFAKNRISGSVDVYYKETEDLLSRVTQPAGTNFINEFTTNVGNMTNKGVEFMINTVAVDQKDFKLNFGFNATYNKNTITNLTLAADPNFIGNKLGGISGGTGNTIQINSVGFNRASYYVYQQVYDAAGKPLDNVFVDRNNDGQITDKDLYRFKDPDADVFLGFNSNFNYKKWTGGFTLRANINNYVYNNIASGTGTYRNIFNPLGYLSNGSKDILATRFSGTGDKYFLSDYYIQNASFLRMDNFNLGYNFGKVIKGAADLTINGNIQNVFVITKYQGIDPEINGGIDNNFYPRPRTFTLGLNLGF
jgi:TonB-linked SusC/RagA family outer membrane protein